MKLILVKSQTRCESKNET